MAEIRHVGINTSVRAPTSTASLERPLMAFINAASQVGAPTANNITRFNRGRRNNVYSAATVGKPTSAGAFERLDVSGFTSAAVVAAATAAADINTFPSYPIQAYEEVSDPGLLDVVDTALGPGLTAALAGRAAQEILFVYPTPNNRLSIVGRFSVPGRPMAIGSVRGVGANSGYLFVITEETPSVDGAPKLLVYDMTFAGTLLATVSLPRGVDARFLWAPGLEDVPFIVVSAGDGTIQLRSADAEAVILAEHQSASYRPRVVDVFHQEELEDEGELLYDIVVFNETTASGDILRYREVTETAEVSVPDTTAVVNLGAATVAGPVSAGLFTTAPGVPQLNVENLYFWVDASDDDGFGVYNDGSNDHMKSINLAPAPPDPDMLGYEIYPGEIPGANDVLNVRDVTTRNGRKVLHFGDDTFRGSEWGDPLPGQTPPSWPTTGTSVFCVARFNVDSFPGGSAQAATSDSLNLRMGIAFAGGYRWTLTPPTFSAASPWAPLSTPKDSGWVVMFARLPAGGSPDTQLYVDGTLVVSVAAQLTTGSTPAIGCGGTMCEPMQVAEILRYDEVINFGDPKYLSIVAYLTHKWGPFVSAWM